MSLQDIAIAIGIPVLRSVGGWATAALQDRKISRFELTRLGETVLRTSILGVFVYIGATSWGVDIDIIATAVTAVLLDLLITALKETQVVRQKFR